MQEEKTFLAFATTVSAFFIKTIKIVINLKRDTLKTFNCSEKDFAKEENYKFLEKNVWLEEPSSFLQLFTNFWND